MGYFTEPFTLTWASFSPATDVAPDVDTEINIEGAKTIAVQGNTTAAGNISDDVDFNIETTLDGTTWDTTTDISMNLGDAEVKTLLVTPGAQKMRLRADNNHAASNAVLSAIVKVSRYL